MVSDNTAMKADSFRKGDKVDVLFYINKVDMRSRFLAKARNLLSLESMP